MALGGGFRPEWLRPKDNWDRCEQLGQLLGKVLAPVVVVVVAQVGAGVLQKQQEREAEDRMYTSIITSREQADSALREKMFNTALASFAEQPTTRLEDKVLMLELLAHNFHEALDLEPLFNDVYASLTEVNAVGQLTPSETDAFQDRLLRLTRTVKRKQIASLAAEGFSKTFTVDLATYQTWSEQGDVSNSAALDDWRLPEAYCSRSFNVDVYDYVPPGRFEVLLKVVRVVDPVHDSDGQADAIGTEEVELIDVFWINHFELPAIRNVRLKGGQRCAVIVRELGETSAQLELVYFPASRASLKEKPYYDEILETYLLRE